MDATTHLMSPDLLDACGTAPPGGLHLIPDSAPEQITCPACLALLPQQADTTSSTPADAGCPTLNWALSAPADHDTRQVVMTAEVWEAWVRSIYARGLHVFPIPTGEDDLPTYGVGCTQ